MDKITRHKFSNKPTQYSQRHPHLQDVCTLEDYEVEAEATVEAYVPMLGGKQHGTSVSLFRDDVSVLREFGFVRETVYVIACVRVSVNVYGSKRIIPYIMGWLQLVRSIKLQVSCAKEPHKRNAFLQKRPIISSILLTVATPCEHCAQKRYQYVCVYTHDR